MARTQEERERRELDGVLVWKDENVRYLTDLRPQLISCKSTALNGALLVPGKAPILFCSGGERDRVDETMPWVEEAHTIPIMENRSLIEGFVQHTLAPVLENHGIVKGQLGMDESTVALGLAIRDTLPDVEIVDGDEVMLAARRIKFPEELQIIEEACAIADAVTVTGLNAVEVGVRELEVAAEAMRTLFRLGGEYAHVMTPFVASGEHMAPPHRIASDKIIRHGDIVLSILERVGAATTAISLGRRSAGARHRNRSASIRRSMQAFKLASRKSGLDTPMSMPRGP